jgi:antirestriction protein
MTEYECPNGHPFRWPRAIECDDCDGSVVMVPSAEVYALRDLRERDGRSIQELTTEVERLRAELARAEQKFENDQVRVLRRTGVCPCCGAEQR